MDRRTIARVIGELKKLNSENDGGGGRARLGDLSARSDDYSGGASARRRARRLEGLARPPPGGAPDGSPSSYAASSPRRMRARQFIRAVEGGEVRPRVQLPVGASEEDAIWSPVQSSPTVTGGGGTGESTPSSGGGGGARDGGAPGPIAGLDDSEAQAVAGAPSGPQYDTATGR